MPEPGWTADARPLDPELLVRTLAHHAVTYVLVGGLAAMIHGYSGATADADLVPALDDHNLGRLADALLELHARVYANPARRDLSEDGAPPETSSFDFTATALRSRLDWHLSTDAGLVDVSLVIDRVGGYTELEPRAPSATVAGVELRIAHLDDIIESKTEAGRPKDLRALPELRMLRDRGER